MKQFPKKRFSVGRRVLVGMGMRPATVQSVADNPSTMGEYVHEVLVDGDKDILRVLGLDIYPVPELDEDLKGKTVGIHIQNSNVANLNVGSQVGMINANLQVISDAGDTEQREVARALEQLMQAVVSEAALREDERREVLEAIATLSTEIAKRPEERSKGMLKVLVSGFPTLISTANGLMTLWTKLEPIIKAKLNL